MTAPTIVVVCGDPGGANAVAPVIELLRAQGRVTVSAFAYLQAMALWAERGIEFDVIDGAADDEKIRAVLDHADLLLTGTSVNEFELEKRFIQVARQLHIPSLSVLDFWSNYALRFRDATGELNCQPDRIAVMDEQARAEMIADGLDSTRIVVTGHPAFDSLEAFRTEFTRQRRTIVRRELGVSDTAWLVLFASQPAFFSEDHADAPPPWLDGERVAKSLLVALEELALSYGREIVLLIRPHPRENPRFFDRLASDSVSVVRQAGGDPRALAMASDLVVGMNTMFLVEAVYLGCTTLSIRLDLPQPDTFPPNRAGLTFPVYRAADIGPVLEKALKGELRGPPNKSQHRGDSSQKVADLVYEMANADV